MTRRASAARLVFDLPGDRLDVLMPPAERGALDGPGRGRLVLPPLGRLRGQRLRRPLATGAVSGREASRALYRASPRGATPGALP